MSQQDTTNDRRAAADERPVAPKRDDQSLGDLFSEMTSDIGLLFRQEIELAKVETRDELKRVGRVAGAFGVAGLGAWMALLFLSLALAWLLDQAMNTALAFAIVGLVWTVVALVCAMNGKKQAAAIEPLPETRQSLKEDVQWVKAQKS